MKTLNTPTNPDDIEALKQRAQKYLFAWMPLSTTIEKQDGFHLTTPRGAKFLDLHGQILSHSMGLPENNLPDPYGIGLDILSPHFGHEIIYKAVIQLGEELEKAGMKHPKIIFQSSGTRANANALRIGKSVLGDHMNLMALENGYSGAGSNVSLTDDVWLGSSAIPLALPITKLSYEKHSEETQKTEDAGRDYRESLADALKQPNSNPYLIAEAGVMGVAGFRYINTKALQEMAIMVHEKQGIVHWDTVQTAPRRANPNHFLWSQGLTDSSNPKTTPDIITGAKGLGGGKSFAYMAFNAELAQRVGEKGLGLEYDTYGIALPGARSFLHISNIVNQTEFIQRLQKIETELRDGLLHIVSENPSTLKFVTGTGAMQGLKFKQADYVSQATEIGRTKTGIVFGTGGAGTIIRVGTKLDSPSEITQLILRKLMDTVGLIKN